MGNKFLILFVFLFSGIIFSSDDSFAQSCPNGQVWNNEYKKCFVGVKDIQEVVLTGDSYKTTCLKQQGTWDETNKKCIGALNCSKFKNANCIDAAAVYSAKQACTKNGGVFDEFTATCDNKANECKAAGGEWVVDESKGVGIGIIGASMAFKCDYSKKNNNQAKCDSNSTLGKPEDHDGATDHCVCNFKPTLPGQPTEYIAGENNSCPTEDPSKKNTQTADVDSDVLPCLQQAQRDIQACADQVNLGQEACNEQSAQNQKYTGPASALANTVASAMHSKGAAAGAAQQCRNAALVSTSSQYAVNTIAQSCNKAINACKSSCSANRNYRDPYYIVKSCENDPTVVDQTVAQQQADRLAQQMQNADDLCSGSGNSLVNMGSNLVKYAGQLGNAFAQAAACDCALTNSCPTDCLKNPSSAACQSSYTDCAQNPTAPACKCVVNPYDSSCKTAVSQLAGASTGGGSNSGYNPTSLSGANTTSPGGGNSLDLGEGGGPGAYIGGNASSDTSSLDFKRANQASTSGGGSGGGAGASKAGEEGLAEEPESKGLAGVFKNITNGVKSMLGLGGSKSSSVGLNKTANDKKLLEEKKKYRGVATADKFCVVGQNGQELCFGRKNMNIFQMINRGYSKQSDTFLDKK